MRTIEDLQQKHYTNRLIRADIEKGIPFEFLKEKYGLTAFRYNKLSNLEQFKVEQQKLIDRIEYISGIVDLHLKGYTVYSIAERYKITPTMVRVYLKNEGVDYAKRKVTSKWSRNREDIIALAQSGTPTDTIAKRFSLDEEVLRTNLIREGISYQTRW